MQLLDGIGHQLRVVWDAEFCALLLPDALVLIGLQVVEMQLVADTPKEGLVGQLQRIEVGGEHQDQVEGDLAVAATAQVEVVLLLFHRHDPAVEQIDRRHPLPTEVVDDENAVTRLELQRRLVQAGVRVEANIQHIQGQFAAGDDDWPLALQQTAVDALVNAQAALLDLDRQWFVPLGIEDLYHCLADSDGAGYPDGLLKKADQSLANISLAGTGRPVNHDRPSRVHRRG